MTVASPESQTTVAEAIVLCAGASTRMGQPKGLLRMPAERAAGASCLLAAHIGAFLDAGLRVTVVLGAYADRHRTVIPPGVRVLLNPDWATTSPSDSADLALAGCGAALITPVDVPPATPETIRALLSAPGSAVVCHGGRDGHPVRLAPPHTRGIRLDMRLIGAPRIEVADPSCVRNLNRPEDYAAWLAAGAGR